MKKYFNKTLRRFALNSLQARLVLSFGTIALLLFLIVYFFNYTYNTKQKLLKAQSEIYKPLEYHSLSLEKSIRWNMHEMQKAIYTQARDSEEDRLVVRLQKNWKSKTQASYDSLGRIVTLSKNEDMQEVFAEISRNVLALEKSHKAAYKILKRSRKIFFKTANSSRTIFYNQPLGNLVLREIEPSLEEVQNLVRELIDKEKVLASSQALDLNSYAYFATSIIFMLIVLLAFACVFFAYYLRRHLSQDLDQLQKYARELQEGNIPTRIKYKHREFEKLTQTLNSSLKSLKNIRKLAIQISDNQLDTDMKIFNEKGDLGKALAKMNEGLSKIAQENERRNWTNNKLAKFSEVLARNADDLEKLGDAITANIVRDLDFNQGTFFVVIEDEHSEENYLDLKATFAYNKKKFVEKRIEKGQGLIGQAWIEGEINYLKEVPKDYVRITSGLGEVTPKVLLIIPLKAGRRVQGVIELAALKDIETFKIDFLRVFAQRLAEAIEGTKRNEQTRQLLLESQQLTQNLQNQEDRMKASVEKLKNTQSVMSDTQKELAEKEANLKALIDNTSNAIMAFDKNYNITVANKALRKFYLEQGLNIDVGQNLLEDLPSPNRKEDKKEYDRALFGEKFNILKILERSNRNFYYDFSYNPIKNDDNLIIGASVFVENVTERKLTEMQLQETEANLVSLINNTEDFMLALDEDFKVLIMNKSLKEDYRKRGFEVKVNTSILDYMNSRKRAYWKNLYQKALQGRTFGHLITTGKFPNKTYIEYWFSPIYRSENREDIIGLSIFGRDITRIKQTENSLRYILLESLEDTESLKVQEKSMKITLQEYQMRIKMLERIIDPDTSQDI